VGYLGGLPLAGDEAHPPPLQRQVAASSPSPSPAADGQMARRRRGWHRSGGDGLELGLRRRSGARAWVRRRPVCGGAGGIAACCGVGNSMRTAEIVFVVSEKELTDQARGKKIWTKAQSGSYHISRDD
jgi:hypothetical protein